MARASFLTTIVGGGPAALAPLVAASRDGRLDHLLGRGVAIVERGSAIGPGRLGNYAIRSDSTAEAFLAAVTDHLDPRLGALLDHELCHALKACGRSAVPLEQAGSLMGLVGGVLHRAVAAAGGRVMVGHEAVRARRTGDGRWSVRVRCCATGSVSHVVSDAVLLATGGHQDGARLASEAVGGLRLSPDYADKIVQSDDVLRAGGIARVADRLAGRDAPRIAIVGGSTSAIATAVLLLRELPDRLRRPDSITLLHRRPLRVFYPSPQAALADGYAEFDARDICPVSGFVFRFAGFREDARDLVMRLRGIGGRPAEPRVGLHRIDPGRPDLTRDVLDRADLVVTALGYRPRLLPVVDSRGTAIELAGAAPGAPAVDQACRILDASGTPVEGLFGIGLAMGFPPQGKFGGEASFVGQANGLWLWQTAVGASLVDGLLDAAPAPLEPFFAPEPASMNAVPA